MALNYSHRPVFPPCISEDNLVSPMRIVNGCLLEGVSDMNGECCLRPWYLAKEDFVERDFNCGRDRADFCSSQDSTSRNIVDLLPSDPFGMDIQSTFTAITGWLEDLEVDYGGYYMMTNNSTSDQEAYGLYAGWDMLWNNSSRFQPFPNTFQLTEQPNREISPSNIRTYDCACACAGDYITSSVELRQNLNTSTVEAGTDCHFRNGSASCSSEMGFRENVDGPTNIEGMPRDVLTYALGHVGLQDLLAVEMVCKSLLSTVRGDPLLWMTIHIDKPLNERITDDVLVQLASRAHGKLQCLSLVECTKITDDSLRHILETNLSLTKLCVPGCTRISIERIMEIMKTFNSSKDGRHGIKHLRIGGRFGVNSEQFDELTLLLGLDENIESDHKPHFYHRDNIYLPHNDDRAIDIEMCPRCKLFKLVYDCPAEGCKIKDDSHEVCRACISCIPRCAECGRCINGTEFEETFWLELLCSKCFKQLPKYQDKFNLDNEVDLFRAPPCPSYDFLARG